MKEVEAKIDLKRKDANLQTFCSENPVKTDLKRLMGKISHPESFRAEREKSPYLDMDLIVTYENSPFEHHQPLLDTTDELLEFETSTLETYNSKKDSGEEKTEKEKIVRDQVQEKIVRG